MVKVCLKTVEFAIAESIGQLFVLMPRPSIAFGIVWYLIYFWSAKWLLKFKKKKGKGPKKSLERGRRQTDIEVGEDDEDDMCLGVLRLNLIDKGRMQAVMYINRV